MVITLVVHPANTQLHIITLIVHTANTTSTFKPDTHYLLTWPLHTGTDALFETRTYGSYTQAVRMGVKNAPVYTGHIYG